MQRTLDYIVRRRNKRARRSLLKRLARRLDVSMGYLTGEHRRLLGLHRRLSQLPPSEPLPKTERSDVWWSRQNARCDGALRREIRATGTTIGQRDELKRRLRLARTMGRLLDVDAWRSPLLVGDGGALPPARGHEVDAAVMGARPGARGDPCPGAAREGSPTGC